MLSPGSASAPGLDRLESKAEATELARTLTRGQKNGAQIAADQWIKEHSGADKDEDEEEKEER